MKSTFKHLTLAMILFLVTSTQLSSNVTSLSASDKNELCGDLLETYATKPEGLAFKKCEVVKHSQTLVEATYVVSGKESKKIEDFLIKHYGMGKLQWICCGWESRGQYGGFEHREFAKIDPYLSAIITMSGSGEVIDESGLLPVRLEFDREKVPFFYVTVQLVIV